MAAAAATRRGSARTASWRRDSVPGSIRSSASHATTYGVATYARPRFRAAPRLRRRGARTTDTPGNSGTCTAEALSTTTIGARTSSRRTLATASVSRPATYASQTGSTTVVCAAGAVTASSIPVPCRDQRPSVPLADLASCDAPGSQPPRTVAQQPQRPVEIRDCEHAATACRGRPPVADEFARGRRLADEDREEFPGAPGARELLEP